uniref:DUF725 domain-containing protein n=1 Tax=Panagrellus redivivus TaxID=6233 RepID=A0A7E4V5Y2_PANRE
MPSVIVLTTVLLFGAGVAHGDAFIYKHVDKELVFQAQKIGEGARAQYIQSVNGILDEEIRRAKYLDALELCDRIGNEEAAVLVRQTAAQARQSDARELMKLGLREFQSQFMTLPVPLMRKVMQMACAKHERQLQCGAVFEGKAITERRIDDLKTIGNHKLMFEYECVDPEFAPRVYPCIGESVPALRAKCGIHMDNYFKVREANNAQIMSTYDRSVNTVKSLKASEGSNQAMLNAFIFKSAMRQIVQKEGEKCDLFKTMRSCVYPIIMNSCGFEAAHAYNESVSLGYLRIERNERLHFDFGIFQIPVDPRCRELTTLV